MWVKGSILVSLCEHAGWAYFVAQVGEIGHGHPPLSVGH